MGAEEKVSAINCSISCCCCCCHFTHSTTCQNKAVKIESILYMYSLQPQFLTPFRSARICSPHEKAVNCGETLFLTHQSLTNQAVANWHTFFLPKEGLGIHLVNLWWPDLLPLHIPLLGFKRKLLNTTLVVQWYPKMSILIFKKF